MCFLGVFSQKQVEDKFLGEKIETLFFQPPKCLKFGEFHTTCYLCFFKKILLFAH